MNDVKPEHAKALYYLDKFRVEFEHETLTVGDAWHYMRKIMYYAEKRGFRPKRWNPSPGVTHEPLQIPSEEDGG